ncbi:hypothetical protein [Sorangium cellulosum]|uniref:hypothetical protein n=1 Tax=Sorangium cellulosum TaxID=56 RepID=UPI0011DD4471|nr:hypothetical protein [Sorangium cellulosum]
MPGRELGLRLEERLELGPAPLLLEQREEPRVRLARRPERREVAAPGGDGGRQVGEPGAQLGRAEGEVPRRAAVRLGLGAPLEDPREPLVRGRGLVQPLERGEGARLARGPRLRELAVGRDRARRVVELLLVEAREPLRRALARLGLGLGLGEPLERAGEPARVALALAELREPAGRAPRGRGVGLAVERLLERRARLPAVPEALVQLAELGGDVRPERLVLRAGRRAHEHARRVGPAVEHRRELEEAVAHGLVRGVDGEDLLRQRERRREVAEPLELQLDEPLLHLDAARPAEVLDLEGHHPRRFLRPPAARVGGLERRGGAHDGGLAPEQGLRGAVGGLVARVQREHLLDVRQGPLDLLERAAVEVDEPRADLERVGRGRLRGERRLEHARDLLEPPGARVALLERPARRGVAGVDPEDLLEQLDRALLLFAADLDEREGAAEQRELIGALRAVARGEGVEVRELRRLVRLDEDALEAQEGLLVRGQDGERALEVGASAAGVAEEIGEELGGVDEDLGLGGLREHPEAPLAGEALVRERELGEPVVARSGLVELRPQLGVRAPLRRGGHEHVERGRFVVDPLLERGFEVVDAERDARALRVLLHVGSGPRLAMGRQAGVPALPSNLRPQCAAERRPR